MKYYKKKVIKPQLHLPGFGKYNIELFNLVYTMLVFNICQREKQGFIDRIAHREGKRVYEF